MPPDHLPAEAPPPAPPPLRPGEHVELWLEAGEPAEADAYSLGWDVRPARVAHVPPLAPAARGGAATEHHAHHVTLRTGSWGLATLAPGAALHVIIRRPGADGIAEWEGEAQVAGAAADPRQHDSPRLRRLAPPELALDVFLAEDAGRLFQRRRSQRLALQLSPVRLTPLASPEGPPGEVDELLLPVARLTDVSQHGAGVVVDCPLAHGSTVALEFDLPGEAGPFSLRGRVVEPAVALHGEVLPQADGLPGFRRGIEFLDGVRSAERRRLTARLSDLLDRRAR